MWYSENKKMEPEPTPAATPAPTPEVIIKEKEIEKIIEVEKEITAEIIRDGLHDMGTLITEEYYFTEVVNFSSMKTLFNIELGFTESSYLASYDGVVTAGIDFEQIIIEKNDEDKLITVSVPRAKILNVDIDPESFEVYSEKTGLGNPVSVIDFNESLIQLEATAKSRAVKRGLLERADENAEKVIGNFIYSLVDRTEYGIVFAE